MNRSVFPDQIDSFTEHFDIQSSDVANVKRYQELKIKTTLTPSEQTELANLTTTLRDKLFTPEDLNKLQDAITNLETFFRDNVEGYIDTKQTEYDQYIDDKTTMFDSKLNRFALRGEFNPTIQYYQWNYVTYMGEGFIAKQDSLGKTPVGDASDVYWLKTGVRGAKGDPGERGVDGVGLNFKGPYDVLTNYDPDDLVTYDGSTWVCMQAISGLAPSTTSPASQYWKLFVAKGGSTVLARYENQVILSSAASNVPIGISQYSYTKDVLMVFQNGMKLTKGKEFNLNPNGTSIDKINDDGAATWNAGTIFDFVVDKNVTVDGSTEIDGTNLKEGSVSLAKLDADTQAKITSADAATLGGYNADDFVLKTQVASINSAGIVQLDDTVTSTSTTTAATPNSVKQAYDLANAANSVANSALPASSYTASDVLEKIKTVDGPSSGLDADMIDGLDSTAFLRKAESVSDVLVTTTTGQDILAFTPPAQSNFVVYIYLRVVTATTNITVTITYTDASGAQTSTIVNGDPYAVGSYHLVPVFLNSLQSAITLTVTANVANQVYVSSSIIGV